jgi:tetratricopeptide (TPR) repeat protein
MKIKYFIISLIILSFFNCQTTKNTKTTEDDFEHYFLRAQDLSNRGKFQQAINLLNETQEKFPNVDSLSITYNLGYNYYQLKNIPKAKQYLNQVITMFETGNYSDAFIQENRKFVILAGIILDKIEKDKLEKKDPYHINEELEKNKTLKPKAKNKPKVVR